MLTFVKTPKGDYRADTKAGPLTCRKRPDGYFDLYAGRKKFNNERGRLKDMKRMAEDYVTECFSGVDDLPPGAAPNSIPLSEPNDDYEVEVAEQETMLDRLDAENPPEPPPDYPTFKPGERVNVHPDDWDEFMNTAEDAAVARLKTVHPKARDMVDRATVLLPEKAVNMPGAEQRVKKGEQKGGPVWEFDTPDGVFEVLTGPVVLAKPPGHGYSSLTSAYGFVPRGTARKLRKALRAAGRPDLAAVSRCMKAGNPDYL